ncbi:MAG: oligopeptide transporter, OPT family [Deltaproteobacteria bacterium]|jgi:putative OPT family oligopeptide transporter|nr:oligopeptide transporter, OPT family [Deltaproteobacteria bacterium]
MNKEISSAAPQPVIVSDPNPVELSPLTIIFGIILSVVFAGANAYLALRIGMTVSSSIPSAVISMGIWRVILKRDSVLENNMVQTIGSAGESLAAGVVFTVPALFFWFAEWGMGAPSGVMIALLALGGGILGVLFMVPLRKSLIVKERDSLPFPEGTACAKVLTAVDRGGSRAGLTFLGVAAGLAYKFIADGLKFFPSEASWSFSLLPGVDFGMAFLPALLGVGFIIGPRVAAFLFGGGALAQWLAIPLILHFGASRVEPIYPAKVPIAQMSSTDIWINYIRYLGAGLIAWCGVAGLTKAATLAVGSFRQRRFGAASQTTARVDRDLTPKSIIVGSVVVLLSLGLIPFLPVNWLGTLIIAFFGFLCVVVTSRIVGLTGASNNPVSGLVIASLGVTALIFRLVGYQGHEAMIAVISIGCVICVMAAIAADTSQDLKTGYLLGATPKKQQTGELFGVLASSLIIGAVMVLLNKAWGFGSRELPAPQATTMRILVEGVMEGHFPTTLAIGLGLGACLSALRLPVLALSLGFYLPLQVTVPLFIGGAIRYCFLERPGKKAGMSEAELGDRVEKGILFSSGLIAGEGLCGIGLAVLAAKSIDLSLGTAEFLGRTGGCLAFALMTYWLVRIISSGQKG